MKDINHIISSKRTLLNVPEQTSNVTTSTCLWYKSVLLREQMGERERRAAQEWEEKRKWDLRTKMFFSFSSILAALAKLLKIDHQAAWQIFDNENWNQFTQTQYCWSVGSSHPPVYKVFFLQVLHCRGDLCGHVEQHHCIDLLSVALP